MDDKRVHVTLKDRKRSLSEKLMRSGTRETATMHCGCFQTTTTCCGTKLPQSKMTFKGTVNVLSNLFIRNKCSVGVMKSNDKAHLFLQVLE